VGEARSPSIAWSTLTPRGMSSEDQPRMMTSVASPSSFGPITLSTTPVIPSSTTIASATFSGPISPRRRRTVRPKFLGFSPGIAPSLMPPPPR
jgi:hypothetical protein